jgi:hypothetical protein
MHENGKMIPAETTPEIGGKEIEENGGWGEFNVSNNIFNTL